MVPDYTTSHAATPFKVAFSYFLTSLSPFELQSRSYGGPHQCFTRKVAQGCTRLHKVAQGCATPRKSNFKKVATSCQFLWSSVSGSYKQCSEGPGVAWKTLITNFGRNWRHPAGYPSRSMWSNLRAKSGKTGDNSDKSGNSATKLRKY
jgi:hypothetical protein